MNKIYSIVTLLALLFSANLFSQRTHFDDKPYVPGEFLVQVTADGNIRDVAKRAPASYEIEIVEYLSPPMRIWLIRFNDDNVEHYQMQNWLYEQKEVSVADYNYKIQMRSTLPNDADFTQQWHHNNTGQTGGTADADIDSDLAWDITTGGQTATNDDIVVCMVEGGGGNLDHQDLSPNRWVNTNEIDGNGIDDDGNGYVDDYNGWNTGSNNDDYGTGGHGTNCLGMIGAKGDNGLNVVGANWDVKLMVLNMGGGLTQSNVIAAYTYPLVMRQMWNNSGGTEGAFVVATSASWGIDGADPSSYPLWCNFYDTLGTYGILNVGATTNQNLDVDTAGDMPTACSSPYMIGVGRTDHNDNTAGGYGDQTIDFGAPGINVVTTANTNTITTTTGTSFSCPLTAGVIGLAYSIPCSNLMSIVTSNPQQGADMVLQALLDGTDPKSQLSSKFITGGRLNSKNTLDNLMNLVCSGSICISPSAVSTSNITDTSADINFTPYDSADQTVIYWQESGTGNWTAISNATSPYNLTGLNACTDYEYYLVSVCNGTDTSGATTTQTFSTSGCGFCIDGAYCSSSATDATDEWIDDFTIDTYSNNSGNDNGYGDYTATSNIVLTRTMTYPISVTPAWSATQYDEYSRIWIDYDQSGTFDAGELAYDQGTATQTTASGNITIPGTATIGSTRMRVQMAYQGSGQSTLPSECGDFTWGEVEDYCVEIIDLNPCAMTITETVTDPSCNGDSDGSISIDNVSGGTAPFTYSWTPGGSTSSSITGLNAGTYSVTITDDNGCDTILDYTLSDPTSLSISNSTTDLTCNGNADGAIDITVNGGTGSYTYNWSNGSSSEDVNNLSGGTYDVTVTDNNGCTINSGNITINEPSAITASIAVTDGDCTTPGSATVNASGGTPSYSYSWSSGGSSATETVTQTQTVSVTVTDNNGCTYTDTATITITGSASLALNTATDPLCNGGSDGSIDVNITGGTAPFTYSWSPSGGNAEDASGLGAGTYTLTATDDAGCVVTFNHTLTEPSAISGTSSSNDVIFGNDGAVDITISGGTPPYSYSWDNGATTEDLTNLNTAGTYTCTVTDANGCTFQIIETVDSQVGLKDLSDLGVNIYPNPTHGLVTMKFSQPIVADITIYNTVGKQLMHISKSGEQIIELDLNDFATGVYIVNINTVNGQINRRITVKK